MHISKYIILNHCNLPKRNHFAHRDGDPPLLHIKEHNYPNSRSCKTNALYVSGIGDGYICFVERRLSPTYDILWLTGDAVCNSATVLITTSCSCFHTPKSNYKLFMSFEIRGWYDKVTTIFFQKCLLGYALAVQKGTKD